MRFHIVNTYKFLKKQLLPLIIIVAISQGCASNSRNNKRLARYQPIVANRNYQMPEKEVTNPIPQTTENVKQADVSTSIEMDKPVASTPVMIKADEAQPQAVVKLTEKKPAASPVVTLQRMRKLKHGDMVTVGLYGIPNQIKVEESIDNFGSISLPLIDVITIVGLGTSAAERKIRDAYINSGFYTDLSVVVMAMADEYFIRGEVKSVGNYPLLGDRTLLQAITAAGGYTDYAKLSKVTILRTDKEPMVFDCYKIAKRRIADPLIHPGDIIIVPRRIFWK